MYYICEKASFLMYCKKKKSRSITLLKAKLLIHNIALCFTKFLSSSNISFNFLDSFHLIKTEFRGHYTSMFSGLRASFSSDRLSFGVLLQDLVYFNFRLCLVSSSNGIEYRIIRQYISCILQELFI